MILITEERTVLAVLGEANEFRKSPKEILWVLGQLLFPVRQLKKS